MQTEAITNENLKKYQPLLSNDEILGIEDGLFSCFGAYDENSGKSCSVLITRSLPEYIRLERLYTLPEYRGQGAGSALLSLVTGLPENASHPFYAIATGKDADVGFLQKKGFEENPKHYHYLCGTLEDLESIPQPQKSSRAFRVLPLKKVPEKVLKDYIQNISLEDRPLFPEMMMNGDRSSENGLICMQDQEICAVLLMEELNEYIKISRIHCNDDTALYHTFSVMKKTLKSEYDPETEIRFLLCGVQEENTVEKIFRYRQRIPLRIYRFG